MSFAKSAVFCLFLWAFVAPARVRAEVDFQGIPPAHTVAQANALLAQRVARVVAHYGKQRPVSGFDEERSHHGGFTRPAMASLVNGQASGEINRALLSATAQPFAEYGTNITIIPGVCERKGDYDFVAMGLVRLAHQTQGRPDLLWPVTRKRIATTLLPARGAEHYERFRLGLCSLHHDTENHILMTESSRYLTNQLLREQGVSGRELDNRTSGFDGWILRKLSGFLSAHFEEYNARPYQGYTVGALENLHDFAATREVASAAGMVLDYLSAIFAVQSNGLRRFPAFRRQERYADSTIVDDHDTESARFAVLAGNYEYFKRFAFTAPYGARFMFSAAQSKYRPHDAILDLIIDKAKNPYYQRLHHDNVEVYASSPSFLISGGGVFVRHFQFGSSEQHGWARPTIVLPTRDTSVDVHDMLRIEGANNKRVRNNTCVLPGFACGVNVRIPESIPARCREQHGPFTFLDLTAQGCSTHDLGFYAVVYTRSCRSQRCAGEADNFGFFELREAGELPFREFVHSVLARNHSAPRLDQLLRYTTSQGQRIVFEPFSLDTTRWPVAALSVFPQQREFARWPLAQGDVINARGDGLVTIDNRNLGVRIELDLRNPLAPRRRVVEGNGSVWRLARAAD